MSGKIMQKHTQKRKPINSKPEESLVEPAVPPGQNMTGTAVEILEEELLDLDETVTKIEAQGINNLKSQSPSGSLFRFNAASDIGLVKEILNVQPFSSRHGKVESGWNQVSVNCGSKFSGESARKRFDKILKNFRSEDSKKLKMSGTDEEYSERDQLLQDASDMERDSREVKKSSKKESSNEEKELGEAIRKEAMVGLAKSEVKLLTPKPKSTDERILELLETQQETDSKEKNSVFELKKRKLDLEERKLSIQENERQENAERWKVECEERKLMMEFFRNQMKK